MVKTGAGTGMKIFKTDDDVFVETGLRPVSTCYDGNWPDYF